MENALQSNETAQIDGVNVFVCYSDDSAGKVTTEELFNYVQRGRAKYPNATLDSVRVVVDGEYVDITYKTAAVPFDRIRRITGYLVGTLDRFNDAKRAEEADRVKHSVA